MALALPTWTPSPLARTRRSAFVVHTVESVVVVVAALLPVVLRVITP